MMFAREAGKRSEESSYERLVRYLIKPKDVRERVGRICVSHCVNTDVETALLEVANVQSANRKVKDKTFHLLVSFRPQDEPSDEALAVIEARLCQALGFFGHQRISVVHHDTDNMHLHVAINRIHPHSYLSQSAEWSHFRLAYASEALERELGMLQETRWHYDLKPWQKHGATLGLKLYLREVAAQALRNAGSWDQVHQLAAGFGVSLNKRANGLVFRHPNGARVKASDVDRELSLAALTRRLGAFRPATAQVLPGAERDTPAERPAKEEPAHTHSPLYARYLAERDAQLADRERALASVEEAQQRAAALLSRQTKVRWRAQRLFVRNPFVRQLWSARIRRQIDQQWSDLSAKGRTARDDAYDIHPVERWLDWLRRHAAEGDQEAVIALRRRSRRALGVTKAPTESRHRSTPEVGSARLDQEYRSARARRRAGVDLALKELQASHRASVAQLETTAQAGKQAMQRLSEAALVRKAFSIYLARRVARERGELASDQRERQHEVQAQSRLSRRVWVGQQAMLGNPQALAQAPTPFARVDHAGQDGSVVYRLPGGQARLDGDGLSLTRADSPAAMEALLHLAYAHFGPQLALDGADEAFRQRLTQAAKDSRLQLHLHHDPPGQAQRAPLAPRLRRANLSARRNPRRRSR